MEYAPMFPFSLVHRSCDTDLWRQRIDGLPSPPYPARNITGDEFVLMGCVVDEKTCLPVAEATVMFDMTNAVGEYDGSQRGTAMTSAVGLFVIRSNRPGAYGGGRPHIHLFVGADNYLPITTAHNLLDDSPWAWITIPLSRADDAHE
jgi:protocatechuate 3,4-dioxygenase beta subunit